MARVGMVFSTVCILALATWTLLGITGRGDQNPFAGSEIILESRAWPSSADEVTFAVIGDYGTGRADQFRVARQMAETYRIQPYGHLLTVGDNVYDGTVVDRAPEVIDRPYRPLWDAGVEFRPALGNHDVGEGGSLSETLKTLGMPNRYYSFTVGPVDFFALDSNWMTSQQLDWLREGLTCSDNKWQVAYMHHPLYSSGSHGSDAYLRAILEPVLVDGGADIVFSGHDHNYERTTPQHGIAHVVTGGGAKLRSVGDSEFTAVSESELHFLLVKVLENDMDVKAINKDGLFIDSFAIEPRPALVPCTVD